MQGTLVNAGSIFINGAPANGAFETGGGGGALCSYGTFDNAGLIGIGAGSPSVGLYSQNGIGGALRIERGVLTNTGTITVAGGLGNNTAGYSRTEGTLVWSGAGAITSSVSSSMQAPSPAAARSPSPQSTIPA